ncbi:PulJ/GspJ family protein [Nitratidesulfovibrio termitidis]|uniref:PulJ/GspJ family protein n=1 Tax=Nitratidesulfovibrio termitidis TaxID=42252 RepID=UPI00040C7081|nr:type II secretion system protein [Nitratidesulfovibrio termitidis]
MNAKGFTLVETIVVLILAGLLAAVAGTGIVTGARSFVDAREASELAQEAQLAMDRLTREIVELVDIPANSSSTLLVLRNVGAEGTAQFNRSIQYVANAQAIRIADGTGGAANGDTLIDNVTAFSLTYWQEDASSTSWAATTDARLLSAIDVRFTLTAPGGTTRQFVNRIVPRNNENRGGASPNAAPPSLDRYDVCFVATAAAGDGDHPVVVQLREFRDRLLLPWSGGRALVRVYYAVGPGMARVVAAHEPLRAATLAILTPVAALAGLAVHAPGWLAGTLVLSVLLVAVAGRALRRGRAVAPAGSVLPVGNAGQRGAVLLSAIVTIVAFSVLAATMVPMMTGSMMGEIAAVQGDQAYYLAESGFGAAGSMFLAAGDEQARKDLLETMDGSTYTLAGNAGSFTLGVEPYWYEVTNNTGTTLTTKAYGTPPTLPANTSGRIRAGTGSTFYAYSNISVSGDTVTFTLTSTPSPLIASGTDIFLSGRPSAGQTVTERGNLALDASNAAAFPLVNGMFTIRDGATHTGRVAYVYRRKNGSTLEDVRLVEGQGVSWSNLALTTGSNITLEAYLRLHSTGTPPGGLPREVIYNVPIGWILGGGNFSKEQYQDTFANLNAWYTGSSSEGHLGGHAVATADGSSALDITGMATASTSGVGAFLNWLTGSNQWSTLFFNWGATNVNLARGWSDAEGFLSYDLQFKMYDPDQGSAQEFFGGLLFRARNNAAGTDLDSFGISFVRYRMTSLLWSDWYWEGDVPSSLVPGYNSAADPGPLFLSDSNSEIRSGFLGITRYKYSVPAIVLWERRNGNFRWLAYKALSGSSSGIVTYSDSNKRYRLANWPTMLVRLVEGQALAFQNGGGADGAGGTLRINYGDEITTATGAKARVIGPPIVTGGAWSSGTASGTLVLTNIDATQGNFGASQAIRVDNVQHAATGSGGLGSKSNYIRVYYSDAGSSTSGNATPYDNTRRSNPRLTTTDAKLNWIPDDYEQWTSTTDYFTLVQWDGVNTVGATGMNERLTDSTDRLTIVRSTNLLSPAYDASNPVFSPSEGISVVTSGPSGDNLYFDDFGLQLDLRGGKGFLPPIQQ